MANRKGLPKAADLGFGTEKRQAPGATKVLKSTVDGVDLYWTYVMASQPIYLLTTGIPVLGTKSLSQWIKLSTGEKGRPMDLNVPEAKLFYSENMGGVDLMDHRRKLAEFDHRTQEFGMRLFFFLVNVSMLNAKVLYNHHVGIDSDFALDSRSFAENLIENLIGNRSYVLRDPLWVVPASQLHWPERNPDVRDIKLDCPLCETGKRKKRTHFCRACGTGACFDCMSVQHKDMFSRGRVGARGGQAPMVLNPVRNHSRAEKGVEE